MSDFELSRVPVNNIISSIRFAPCPHSERHNRRYFALFLKIHGLSYAINGSQTCSFDPRHVVLLPKGSSYRITSDDPGETYTIEFDCADDFVWNSERLSSWTLRDPTLMASLFSEAARIWTFKKTAYFSRCMSILYRIFAELERGDVYVSPSGREKLRAAQKCLEERFSDPSLSVDDLAAAAGMSRSYFAKLFSEIYRVPPAKYLTMIRLEKAKVLLSEGGLSVGKVAESVGYSSLYYFSSAFRRETGVCPSEFANRLH